MAKYYKIIVAVVVAVVLFGWIASVQIEQTPLEQSGLPKVNQQAPDFTLQEVSGEQVTLSSLKGKVVYVKFWASWCGDCLKQVVPQRNLEKQLQESDQVLFVNISIDKDENAWRKAVARNNLKAVELLSRDGVEGNINALYDLDEIPRYVLIGKNGQILNNDAPKPDQLDEDYFTPYF